MAVNGNWLRRKSTDSIVKGLFRAARKSDYAAAFALLDRLSETGHDDFASILHHAVTTLPGGSDRWRARFVSWRVEEYMCGERVVVKCCRCNRKMWAQPDSPPFGWTLDREEPRKMLCTRCNSGPWID